MQDTNTPTPNHGQLSEAEQKAYYERLRKGSKDFDPLTAKALLMQVEVDNAERERMRGEHRHLNVMPAILFPWRLFDPRYEVSSMLKAIIIITGVAVLLVGGFFLPKLH